jgi:hypothetical protein
MCTLLHNHSIGYFTIYSSITAHKMVAIIVVWTMINFMRCTPYGPFSFNPKLVLSLKQFLFPYVSLGLRS